MRILIISRHRTRSSLLCYTLEEYYQIFNKMEYYQRVLPALEPNPLLRLVPKLNLKNYKISAQDLEQGTKKLTDDLFSIPKGFVIKLFPKHLLAYNNINDFQYIKNISHAYNLSGYDVIYTIDRPVVESTMSYLYAEYRNVWMVRTEYWHKTYQNQKKPIVITDRMLKVLDLKILEYVIQTKLKAFVHSQPVPVVDLQYDSLPDFCEKNFLKSNTIIDLKNNYKELISNYTEIESLILEKIDKISIQAQDIEFI